MDYYLITVSEILIRDTQIADTSAEGFKEAFESGDQENIRWCDLDDKEVVLGIVQAESPTEAKLRKSIEYTTDIEFLRSYKLK